MRKDKGLNGDLDRLPMLTWIMFLKFLDDMEQIARAGGAAGAAEVPPRHRTAVPLARLGGEGRRHHRRRVDQLSSTTRKPCGPTARKAPACSPICASLQGANGGDRRDVIATVFKGTINRMISGYLLRDVINKVSGIHFTSSEEIHTLGPLYESMLREMRDAAGDSGEFYTPRPVVRFMVEVTEPAARRRRARPGLRHRRLSRRGVQASAEAVQNRRGPADAAEPQHLRRRGQAAAVPACQMNLLLHGLDSPQIDPRQQPALQAHRDRRQGSRRRDPHQPALRRRGGARHPGQFPRRQADRRNGAALPPAHHAQAQRRQPKDPRHCGRAAVVVPNGTLFGDGVCARIKEELLKEFNLHTIVRLPNGVFAPYTSIPTNMLFFDRSGPTRMSGITSSRCPKAGRTTPRPQPIQFEEFAGCLAWWHGAGQHRAGRKRTCVESARRRVAAPTAATSTARTRAPRTSNISRPNNSPTTFLRKSSASRKSWRRSKRSWQRRRVKLGKLAKQRRDFVFIDDFTEYKRCRVQLHARGIVLRDVVLGAEIKTKKQQTCKPGDFLVAEIDAKVGGFGIVPDDLDGAIVSSHYFLFEVDENILNRRFLDYFIRTPAFCDQVTAQGSTNYAAIRPNDVLGYTFLLPRFPSSGGSWRGSKNWSPKSTKRAICGRRD